MLRYNGGRDGEAIAAPPTKTPGLGWNLPHFETRTGRSEIGADLPLLRRSTNAKDCPSAIGGSLGDEARIIHRDEGLGLLPAVTSAFSSPAVKSR